MSRSRIAWCILVTGLHPLRGQSMMTPLSVFYKDIGIGEVGVDNAGTVPPLTFSRSRLAPRRRIEPAAVQVSAR